MEQMPEISMKFPLPRTTSEDFHRQQIQLRESKEKKEKELLDKLQRRQMDSQRAQENHTEDQVNIHGKLTENSTYVDRWSGCWGLCQLYRHNCQRAVKMYKTWVKVSKTNEKKYYVWIYY